MLNCLRGWDYGGKNIVRRAMRVKETNRSIVACCFGVREKQGAADGCRRVQTALPYVLSTLSHKKLESAQAALSNYQIESTLKLEEYKFPLTLFVQIAMPSVSVFMFADFSTVSARRNATEGHGFVLYFLVLPIEQKADFEFEQ